MEIERNVLSGMPNWCFRCNKKRKPTRGGLCPACLHPMERVTLGSTANREGILSIAVLAVITGSALFYERTHPSSDLWAQIATLILFIGTFLLLGLFCMSGISGPGRDLLVRAVPVGQHPIYEQKSFSCYRFFGEMAKMVAVGFGGGIILVGVIFTVFLFRVLVYFLFRTLSELIGSIL